LQDANEVRIGHRRERMVLHPGFGEQRVADEQVTAKDRAPVFRKGRAREREVLAEFAQQGIGDRADVSGVGGIERRTVLEEELAAPAPDEPTQRGERRGDGLRCRNRARLERDDERVRRDVRSVRRHADRLNGPHPTAHEHIGEIRRAGKIVGDAPE
jgi:hypothetical protein